MAERKLDEVDESGVDRRYVCAKLTPCLLGTSPHGKIMLDQCTSLFFRACSKVLLAHRDGDGRPPR